jgi:hypothetical protein
LRGKFRQDLQDYRDVLRRNRSWFPAFMIHCCQAKRGFPINRRTATKGNQAAYRRLEATGVANSEAERAVWNSLVSASNASGSTITSKISQPHDWYLQRGVTVAWRLFVSSALPDSCSTGAILLVQDFCGQRKTSLLKVVVKGI